LPCETKLLLRNPKKWQQIAIWQNLLSKAVGQKVLLCRQDDDDDDDDDPLLSN
jgi:hypothetical protein